MFRFADPWLLLLLLLLPAAYLVRRATRRSRSALRYSAVRMILGEPGRGSRWTRTVPALLRAMAVAAAVVALARPQSGITSTEVGMEGIDIVLALDVSSSMLALDLQPNRLEAAKAVGTDFVEGRPNDRIGLVAFAGEAFTQAPLTLDRNVVVTLIDELETGMVDDGTAVGMGLATAVKRLEGSLAESKVVILLTDGRNNSGEIGPSTAAEIAEALGVKVYTIGVGGVGPTEIPLSPRPARPPYSAVGEVDIDEESLREIAETTSGRYFRATDTESLAAIYAEIDALERTELPVTIFSRYEELFHVPLAAALAFLLLELILRRTLFRTLP